MNSRGDRFRMPVLNDGTLATMFLGLVVFSIPTANGQRT